MTSKKQKQEAFWQSMMTKYEKRNSNLKQQQCDLLKRIQKMEECMNTRKAQMESMNKSASPNDNQCSCEDPSDVGNKSGKIVRCDCKLRGPTCDCISCDLSVNDSSTGSCPCSHCETNFSPEKGVEVCACETSEIECSCPPSEIENKASAASRPSDNKCECNDSNENDSVFSIQSSDLLYMSKINELANREKQMKLKIRELENREQAYANTLKQADEMWVCLEECYKKRVSNAHQGGDNNRMKFEKMSNQLKEENIKLSNEVEDIKLELKQCLERVEGPLCRKLEQERRKCEQLEKELQYSSQATSKKDMSHMKDMSGLKTKLDCTCANMSDLTARNEILKQEMCCLKCKYDQLQQDLINQKISEARTLEQLNGALAAEKCRCAENAAKKEGKKDCKDLGLHEIARNLSETLLEINNCCECKNIPGDLKDTVQGIKVICDLVDNQSKKMASGGNDMGPGPGPDGSEGPGGPTPSCGCNSEKPSASGFTPGPCQGQPEAEAKPDVGTTKPACECLTDQEEAGANEVSIPGESGVNFMEPSGYSQISETLPAEDQIVEVITEIEAGGDMDIDVETEVKLAEAISSGINISTTITSSGILEIVTDAPTGIIETTMTYSKEGHIEVTTAVTDNTDKDQISAMATSSFVIASKKAVTVAESSLIYKPALEIESLMASKGTLSSEASTIKESTVTMKTKSVEFVMPKEIESKLVTTKPFEASEATPFSKTGAIVDKPSGVPEKSLQISEVKASTPEPTKETKPTKLVKTVSEPFKVAAVKSEVKIAVRSEAGATIKAVSSAVQIKVEKEKVDVADEKKSQVTVEVTRTSAIGVEIPSKLISEESSSISDSEGAATVTSTITHDITFDSISKGVSETTDTELIEIEILAKDIKFVDVQEKRSEYEAKDIDAFYFDTKSETAETIGKANRDALLAVEQANKDVKEALERANRDIENALAAALGTGVLSEVLFHPTLEESVPRDVEDLMEPLRTSVTLTSESKAKYTHEASSEMSETISISQFTDGFEGLKPKPTEVCTDVYSSVYQQGEPVAKPCVSACASVPPTLKTARMPADKTVGTVTSNPTSVAPAPPAVVTISKVEATAVSAAPISVPTAPLASVPAAALDPTPALASGPILSQTPATTAAPAGTLALAPALAPTPKPVTASAPALGPTPALATARVLSPTPVTTPAPVSAPVLAPARVPATVREGKPAPVHTSTPAGGEEIKQTTPAISPGTLPQIPRTLPPESAVKAKIEIVLPSLPPVEGPTIPPVDSEAKPQVLVDEPSYLGTWFGKRESLQRLVEFEYRSNECPSTPECTCSICSSAELMRSEAENTIHHPDCDCIDCLCNPVGPDPKVNTCHPVSCDCLDCLCADVATLKRGECAPEEAHKLEEIVNNIKCACYAAELGGGHAAQKIEAYIASYGKTLSGMQLALTNLQSKCSKKDQMICSMIQELKMQTDGKVLNEMLQNLSLKDPTVLELCNKVAEEWVNPICQDGSIPRDHPDFSDCSCSKLEMAKSEKCNHSNYPDFPCETVEKSEKLQKPSRCNHADYPNCPCGISKEMLENPSCNHPNYPNCPCTTENEDEDQLFYSTTSCTDKKILKRGLHCSCTRNPKASEKVRTVEKKKKSENRESQQRTRDFPSFTKGNQITSIFRKHSLTFANDSRRDSYGLKVLDVRKISPDTLFVKWKPSFNESVIGYEVWVNGEPRSQVRSSRRTSAVVDTVEIKSAVRIDIHAMTLDGVCKPAAKAIYQV